MPAGDVGLIDPAGLMWSVVTESPSAARTRAPRIGSIGIGFRVACQILRAYAHMRAATAS